ncbi:hypothetical protein SLA2020_157590 [Shorea laevis]
MESEVESRSKLRLPVIDFSKQELEWDSVKSQVRPVLEDYGVFEGLIGKVPDLGLREALFGAFEEIFDLPLQTKQRNVLKKGNLGYIGQLPRVPLYESVAIPEAISVEKVDEGFTNLLWPEGNPTLR